MREVCRIESDRTPNPIATIAFQADGGILFSSWHNLVRPDALSGQVIARDEERGAAFSARQISDRCVLSTHLHFVSQSGTSRWALRDAKTLEVITEAPGGHLAAEPLVAISAPRFAVQTDDEVVVYAVVDSGNDDG